MRVGDLVRVKWTRRISKMNSDNIRKIWARDNTPLLIIDMPHDEFHLVATVLVGDRREKVYARDLTTRMW